MKKPTVTIRHDASHLIGGFLFIITSAIVGLTFVKPADQESGLITYIVITLSYVCCAVCFFWGASSETLDENGIYLKRPFCSKQYLWSDVTNVSVKVVQQYRRKGPEFSLKITNRRFPLTLDYTKSCMVCISYYYGEPDQDKWGEPPVFL